MEMTPERVAARVESLIEAIRHGLSDAFAEHNAALTIEYLQQVRDMGIINGEQFITLLIAVNEAADNWQPRIDSDGMPLAHDLEGRNL